MRELVLVTDCGAGGKAGGVRTEEDDVVKHTTVADVMTRDVVAVHADTSFRDVVGGLAEHGVSGAPVVDSQRHVVGMVTEADLMGRQALAGGVIGSSMRHLLRQRAFARRGVTRTAGQLMSTPAVTVAASARLTAAAATMARHGVKRLPVIDDDHVLVGIVSRKDVLSVYLRPDAELAADIRSEVLETAVQPTPSQVSAEVSGGVVTLHGTVQHPIMIDLITSLAAAVDGVVDVRSELVAADATTAADSPNQPPPGSP